MSENNVNSTEEIVLSVEMGDAVSAQTAEAYAVGKRGGVDVAETDPTWHNNAKYYAEQAEEAAGEAQGAEEAAQRAEAAQAAAEAARDRAEAIGAGAAQSAAAAAESAQAAATAKTGAETAQSAAAGSATAAEGSAGRASQSATAAAGSATAAGTAKTAAETARDAAAGSATAAAGSASAADQSAQAAAASAQAAEDVAESIPADYSQLSADVTGLKSAFEQFDANVITESAGPAPIVSIADGADGMPMRKVEVAIEPVQDLHGYDAPWPAGGGKNLLPDTPRTATNRGCTFTYDNGLVTLTGTGTQSGGRTALCTNAFVLKAGTYTFKQFTNDPLPNMTIVIQDGNTAVKSFSGSYTTFTLESDLNSCSIGINVGEDVTYNYSALWGIFTDSEVTDWTPYSNVCPISGWTGAKVTRTGKNLLGPSTCTPKKFIKQDGTIGNSDNWSVSDFIPVKGGQIYTISGIINSGSAAHHAFYDSSKTFKISVLARNHATFIVPDDASFVRLSMNTETPDTIQLELGSTASEFVPFEEIYSVQIPLGQTVYGGTLDVVSGKLVVDRIKLPVNDENKSGASLGWLVTSKGNRLGFPIKNTILPLIDIGNDGTDRVLCNVGKVSAGPNNANTFVPGECCLYRGSSNMFFRYITSTDITSADDAFAYLKSIGAEFVSPIPAPVEISLTPTEIKTLLGINNVWSDAGNISITYPADTKTYIDNRINSTRKLIAGIETGFTASKLYAVGDMLIIGDDLYKVTAQIASGATITVGTNVTKTTVAEQLLALVNA